MHINEILKIIKTDIRKAVGLDHVVRWNLRECAEQLLKAIHYTAESSLNEDISLDYFIFLHQLPYYLLFPLSP